MQRNLTLKIKTTLTVREVGSGEIIREISYTITTELEATYLDRIREATKKLHDPKEHNGSLIAVLTTTVIQHRDADATDPGFLIEQEPPSMNAAAVLTLEEGLAAVKQFSAIMSDA